MGNFEEINDWREWAIKQLEPDILMFSRRYKVKGMSPDDIAQELRIRFWHKLFLFDPEKGNLRTWGWVVIRNCIINLYDSIKNKEEDFPLSYPNGHESHESREINE